MSEKNIKVTAWFVRAMIPVLMTVFLLLFTGSSRVTRVETMVEGHTKDIERVETDLDGDILRLEEHILRLEGKFDEYIDAK